MSSNNFQRAQRIVERWIEDNDINKPLDLSSLHLENLPEIPKNVKFLFIDHNNLTKLPELPSELEELDCKYNKLTHLPILPDSLKRLNCERNNLRNLPELPKNLQYLKCNRNNLPSVFDIKETTETMAHYVIRIRNLIHLKHYMTKAQRNAFINATEKLPRNITKKIANYMNENNLHNIVPIRSLKPSKLKRGGKRTTRKK